jgi:hypothetical protein
MLALGLSFHVLPPSGLGDPGGFAARAGLL